jgi:hypothetical protein
MIKPLPAGLRRYTLSRQQSTEQRLHEEPPKIGRKMMEFRKLTPQPFLSFGSTNQEEDISPHTPMIF